MWKVGEDSIKFSVEKIAPCADYGKITLEGKLQFYDKFKLQKKLIAMSAKIKNISNGRIVIIKTDKLEMYIYDGSRFVISKVLSEEIGIDFLNSLFG